MDNFEFLEKPVAVAALTSQEDLGYIANVSLREARGEGFGTKFRSVAYFKKEK